VFRIRFPGERWPSKRENSARKDDTQNKQNAEKPMNRKTRNLDVGTGKILTSYHRSQSSEGIFKTVENCHIKEQESNTICSVVRVW
jgi:hypothetical protein